jgi:hypothetical protein
MGLSVKQKLRKALKVAGDTYTFEDILFEIDQGNMQSFAEGESWVVTQIVDFPQKRFLEIVFAIGNLDELKAIYPRLEDFARDNVCDGLRAFGRPGWMRQLEIDKAGWVETSRTYIKEF